MIGIMVSLAVLTNPDYSMNGIYCDEVATEIIKYNRETNAFSEDEVMSLIGNCELWEERYEESGDVEEINN